MDRNRFTPYLIVLVTLPLGIIVCRGRDMPLPHRQIDRTALVAARLKERATKQAQGHDPSAPAKLIHKRPARIAVSRVRSV